MLDQAWLYALPARSIVPPSRGNKKQKRGSTAREHPSLAGVQIPDLKNLKKRVITQQPSIALVWWGTTPLARIAYSFWRPTPQHTLFTEENTVDWKTARTYDHSCTLRDAMTRTAVRVTRSSKTLGSGKSIFSEYRGSCQVESTRPSPRSSLFPTRDEQPAENIIQALLTKINPAQRGKTALANIINRRVFPRCQRESLQ